MIYPERINKFLHDIMPEILFAVMLVVLLVPIWSLNFFPTLDAPGHVNNGFILRDLISGHSEFYNNVFELNPNWSPNWLSQLLLAGLSSFFSPIDCERIVHSLYIILFAGGFRFFARSFSGFTNYFGLLGFVFIYNYTFILGFFNFNLSIAIFLWCIGLLHRVISGRKGHSFWILAMALVVLYSSHLVGIVSFFVYALVWAIVVFIRQLKSKEFVSELKRLWMPLVLSFMPSFLLLLLYITSDQEAGVFQSLPSDEIMRLWKSQAGLFCFNDAEDGFTRWNYFVVIAGLLVTIFVLVLRKRLTGFDHTKGWWVYSVSWTLFSILILAMAYIVPDASSGGGGMLTIRLVFISGMFAILALLSLLRIRLVLMVAVVVLLIVTADKVSFVKRKQAEKNYFIKQITEVSKKMENQGVLVFLDFRGGWPLGHYAKVLATEHNLVALDNLGAHKPFSPIQWTNDLRKNDNHLCWVGDQWNCDPRDLDDRLQEQNIYILKWGEFEERDSGAAVKERWNAFFERSCSLVHDDDQGMQLYLSIPAKRGEVEPEKF